MSEQLLNVTDMADMDIIDQLVTDGQLEWVEIVVNGTLVPDSRLQDIADAWNNRYVQPGIRKSNPKLCALLDALTQETTMSDDPWTHSTPYLLHGEPDDHPSEQVRELLESGWLEPDTRLQDIAEAASEPFLWCSTHWRVPEDGTDLCGDEWREIGDCVFGQMVIVPADALTQEDNDGS